MNYDIVKKILLEEGFELSKKTVKVNLYRQKNVLFYLDNELKTKIQLYFDPEDSDLISFLQNNFNLKISFHKGMISFPKKMRYGKTPSNYGQSVALKSIQEFKKFLSYLKTY